MIRKHRNNAHNLNIRNEIQISSQIQKTRLFPVHIIVYNRPIEKNYKIQMTARKKKRSQVRKNRKKNHLCKNSVKIIISS